MIGVEKEFFNFRAVLLAAALVSFTGCGLFQDYNRQMRDVRAAANAGDIEQARLEALGNMRADGQETRLNPWLELGAIDHTAGHFDASIQSLQTAARIVRDYERQAVISASQTAAQAATLIVNEKAQPYYGESFEKTLIHTYLAMNYLMQGDWEGARVESRLGWQRQEEAARDHEKQLAGARDEAKNAQAQLDPNALTQRLNQVYGDQHGVASRVANAYQNAFTHFLAAVVYRAQGEQNETYVELKRAQKLRPGAECLGPLLIETATAGGFHEDIETWERAFGLRAADVLDDAAKRPVELIVLFENGWAPQKQETLIPFPTPYGIVRLAIPKYQQTPGASRGLRIDAGELHTATTLLGDIEAQAVRALQDRMTAYVIKTVVRVTIRLILEREMQKKMQKEHGDTGALLAFAASSAANLALEQADLRAWSLLPRDLQAARLRLPEGRTRVTLTLEGGPAPTTLSKELDLRAGTAPCVIIARSAGAQLYVSTNQ